MRRSAALVGALADRPGRDSRTFRAQIAVFGVPLHECPDERAFDGDLQTAGADVIERARSEPAPETATLEIAVNLGVEQDQAPAHGSILGEPDHSIAEARLIALLARRVDDLESLVERTRHDGSNPT